jgi:hypothetical protein
MSCLSQPLTAEPVSNFAFLHPEWPDIHNAAAGAESLAHPDPRTSCFYSATGVP